MKRQNIQPKSLAQRVVGGRVLYSHVVTVEGKKTIPLPPVLGILAVGAGMVLVVAGARGR